MPTWLDAIANIMDGEPVDAGVAGRPDRQLAENLNYLKTQLDSIVTGEALIARRLPCDPETLVGQVVYWDPIQKRAAPALALQVFDPHIQSLVAAPQADVFGVVLCKPDTTTVDVILVGWSPLNLANAVSDPTLPGHYYLSDIEPGKLVNRRPSLSLPVLFATGDGRALVLPSYRNWEMDHAHYRVPLVCLPAGTSPEPAVYARHTVTVPDANRKGWLPANHASFAGHAPIGAKFGYNLAQHPELNNLWPPFPVGAATLIFDRGVSYIGGTEVPLGPEGLAILDLNGLWWMSDCYDNVPWPATEGFIDGSDSAEVSESISLSACPRAETMTLQVCFARALYDTSRTMVTSLSPAAGSVITIQDRNGQPAKTGDLFLDAVLSLLVNPTSIPGFVALKGIGTDGKLTQGPVVEGVLLGGSNLLASSTSSQVVDDQVVYQGLVTLSASLNPVDRELLPVVIRLQDTRDRFENGILYLGFPVGFISSQLSVYCVPPAGLPANPRIVFRLLLLGVSAGPLPELLVSYLRIPAGTSTPQTLSGAPVSLTMPTLPSTTTANQYVSVDLSPIVVVAGDTLFLTVQRTASDGYGDEVGLIRMTAVLTQG